MSLRRRFERMKLGTPRTSVAGTDSGPSGKARGEASFEHRRESVAGRSEDLRPALAALMGEAWLEGRESLLCIDTETTGLGGSSHPFVIGLARVPLAGGAVDVEQFCITHPMGELASMRAFFSSLEAYDGPALASFNGRAFDLPLLRRRALRLGLSVPPALGGDAAHADLLPIARRFFRGRYEDCRLQTLERERLGVHRHGDIPSFMIPAVFEALVRDPRSTPARARYAKVVEHNRRDIVSLPALISDLARVATEPEHLAQAVEIARHRAAIGAAQEAVEALEMWLWPRLEAEAGDGVALGFSDGLALKEGALLAARWARRRGDGRSWGRWLEAAGARFHADPEVCEALAKYLEHGRKDEAAALRVAQRSAAPCPRRIARLLRKLGVEGAVPSGDCEPGSPAVTADLPSAGLGSGGGRKFSPSRSFAPGHARDQQATALAPERRRRPA